MAKKQKGSHKLGRSKRNGQAARYKNERIDLQNKLERLLKLPRITGMDMAAAIDRCEAGLGKLHRTQLPFDPSKYHYPDYTQYEKRKPTVKQGTPDNG